MTDRVREAAEAPVEAWDRGGERCPDCDGTGRYGPNVVGRDLGIDCGACQGTRPAPAPRPSGERAAEPECIHPDCNEYGNCTACGKHLPRASPAQTDGGREAKCIECGGQGHGWQAVGPWGTGWADARCEKCHGTGRAADDGRGRK